MESIEIITNLNLKNKLAWTCPGTKGKQMQILQFCDLKLEWSEWLYDQQPVKALKRLSERAVEYFSKNLTNWENLNNPNYYMSIGNHHGFDSSALMVPIFFPG